MIGDSWRLVVNVYNTQILLVWRSRGFECVIIFWYWSLAEIIVVILKWFRYCINL